MRRGHEIGRCINFHGKNEHNHVTRWGIAINLKIKTSLRGK